MLLGFILPLLFLYGERLLQFCVPKLRFLKFGSQPSNLIFLLLELNMVCLIVLLHLALQLWGGDAVLMVLGSCCKFGCVGIARSTCIK